ncbi:hypothetical protein GCM10009801_25270 [Streptomyces albiaxialis]|uniref:Integral membrane protein n=1 Tax=Streptomyces albiaxialis TaxID=329523 RepID=A0ABP5HI66_9ACTN
MGAVSEQAGQKAGKKKGTAGSGGTGGGTGGGPRRGPAPRAAAGTAAKSPKAAGSAAGGSATGGSATGGGEGWGAWPVALGPRVLVYVALAVLGVLTGAAGTLVQSAWAPAGLLLALAGAVGLFWGGAKLCRTKVGAAAPGGGWAIAVLLMTASRPEGDFLFAAGIGSYVYLFGGILAAVMCTTIALPAPPVPANKYR